MSLILMISGCQYHKLAPLRWNIQQHSDVSNIFIWDSSTDTNLVRLKNRFDLINITKKDRTDLDKILTISALNHNNRRSIESDTNTALDPVALLLAEREGKQLSCLEEAYTLAASLNSIGIPARVLTLLPEDVEKRQKNSAHFVVEAFPKEVGKWVMVDPAFKCIPFYKGNPIHAVQLRHALTTDPGQLNFKGIPGWKESSYIKSIGEYLYYFEVPIDNRQFQVDITGRSSKVLVLCPLGSQRPYHILNIDWRNILYTTSVQVFYSPPVISSENRSNPLRAVMDGLTWDLGDRKKILDFKWNNPDDPYLIQLRKENHIDELVSACGTALDSVLTVMNWVHNLWEHDGSGPPERNDPSAIIIKARQGKRFSCLEYSSVLAGSLTSLGFKARVVDLHPIDVETRANSPVHVVVEVYLPAYRKWAYADAQWNVMPMLNDSPPLNAVELQSALWKSHPDLRLNGFSNISLKVYSSFIAEYLYYFNSFVDHRNTGSFVADRSYDKIMLVPFKFTKPSKIMEHPLRNVYFTSSLADFYSIPL